MQKGAEESETRTTCRERKEERGGFNFVLCGCVVIYPKARLKENRKERVRVFFPNKDKYSDFVAGYLSQFRLPEMKRQKEKGC